MKWIVRALIALAVVLVVAFTALFVASQREGSARLEASVEIGRPAAEVWPWLVEPAKLKSWVGWLKEVENPDGAFAAQGQRQVWTMEDRNNNNQLMRLRNVAEEFSPPSRLVLRVSAAEGFTGVSRFELSESGGRTRLRTRADYEFNHWFAKLLAPLIINQANAKLVEDLNRMKALVESAPK
jgi:uncharacterized protein YndB with AHSA1/START domain